MERARGRPGHPAARRFTHNSTEFLRREQDLLLARPRRARGSAPGSQDAPVVVVVRGYDYQTRAAPASRAFIREQHPVLIGVDAGADALLEAGLPARHRGRRRARDDADAARGQDAARGAATSSCAPTAAAGRARVEPARAARRPARCCSRPAATPEDAALLLADAARRRR